MPLNAPNLDDRRYADILAEAKTLIPRYAPEWTDHNDSDPGITLAQLFAWMTDLLLYRLNQVPERNYIKFLQLLGVELKPAQPARAELTFTLARDDVESVIIPKGTQVAVADAGEDSPLVFETDQALIALGATLDAVQVFDGFSYTVQTTSDEAKDQSYEPFGTYAREESALMLGFDSTIAFTDKQVDLAVYVDTQGAGDECQLCQMDLSRLPVPATLAWEYWDGTAWKSLSLDKDGTRAFTRSGHVTFTGPGKKAQKAALGAVLDKLYWIRCRLKRSTYEKAPKLETILTNTTRATQAVTVTDEVLGGSDGTPSQTFTLENAPVVVRDKSEEVVGADGEIARIKSLQLEVDEGHGFEVWQEVDDFYASGPDDAHYVLNRTTGQVWFGDGKHGRIPVANQSNLSGSIVARAYRYGGGKTGNVGVGKITDLQTSVESVDAVTNLRAAYGGTDEETVKEAKLRAPREVKSKERAVTTEDFETLALATTGVSVRRAKALPLTHPKFPNAQVPGVVTVIIVPDSDDPNPLPNETTLRIVCAHLNKHRLLTTEVYVAPPTYRKVKIEADIIVRPDADLAVVKRAVQKGLATYFHPLKGGEAGTGWEFGRDVYYSEVYRATLDTKGVDRIKDNQLVIWLDDERQQFCRDVPVNPGELLYSDEHDIRVSYSTGT
jgi:predicted phage baseplate assembly protein